MLSMPGKVVQMPKPTGMPTESEVGAGKREAADRETESRAEAVAEKLRADKAAAESAIEKLRAGAVKSK